MTRKDYELIAGAFRTAMQATEDQAITERAAMRSAIRATAIGLAQELWQENPAFDPPRFYEAAGVL